MAKYLLIESRSPFESGDVQYFYELARELVEKGNDVTLYLIQNGVFAARRAAKENSLHALAEVVKILADDVSLQERSISGDNLVEGVFRSDLGALVDMVADGVKAVWH
jgi:sulfur relay (sulfurtransferase) complex TusBCD TusD component (DsrE family)